MMAHIAPQALGVLVKITSPMWFTLFGFNLLGAAAVAGGCSDPPELVMNLGGGGQHAGGGGSGGGAAGGGATSSTSSADGRLDIDGGMEDAPLNEDTACVATVAEATLTRRPVDVIFVIDNSASMANEIVSVQRNINDNFAAIIAESGIDYRVIMLAEHGDPNVNDSVCVGAPLSGTTCAPVPPQPANNPPTFFHYSYPNESHNSLCNILGTYNGVLQDQYGLAPQGWSAWVRPDSLKVFVQITDDNVACQSVHLPRNFYFTDQDSPEGGASVAARFESELFQLQPAVFGDAMERNYVFHSIVGLGENAPETQAWEPTEPLVMGSCGTAVAPGTGYQVLSQTTGGLRFPLCQFASYDVVFQAIAEGVVTGSVVACEYGMPQAPPGETIDPETIVVQYTPGGAGEPQHFAQVQSLGACTPQAFYRDGETLKLCPDACATVQADSAAKVNVLYGCTSDVR